jgi:hypothetical protein
VKIKDLNGLEAGYLIGKDRVKSRRELPTMASGEGPGGPDEPPGILNLLQQ